MRGAMAEFGGQKQIGEHAGKGGLSKQAPAYPNGMTKRQWEFAQNCIDGMSLSDAYRAAYSTEGMNAKTIHVQASKQFKHPKVLLTINQHVHEVGKNLYITTESLTARAMEAYEMAKKQSNPGQMLNAVAVMSRLHGMNKDRKEVRIEDARVPKGKQVEMMREVSKLAQSLGFELVIQETQAPDIIDVTPTSESKDE